jgi:tetratricopeptide (TPR) repeat protein
MNRAVHNPADLTQMAGEFRLQGRLRDALLHCDAALQIDPRYVPAWLERGFAFASGGSMASASECYRQVVALEPGNADAHAGLASIAARDGDSAEGRAHAHAALSADPGNAIAAAALATMDIESGAPDAARALVEPLLAGMDQADNNRAMLAGLLGDACAKLGDAPAAHAAYTLSKSDFATIFAPHFANRESATAMVQRIHAGITAMDPSGWQPAKAARPANAAATHIFLLGYPRSGNTLVENILASILGVTALEERPTLQTADMEFLVGEDGLARLSGMAEPQLDPFRQAYWDKVAAAGADVTAQGFVDMDPLKGLRLPLIARLFPDARVLIMRRDPRDVVWSCFHTNFALTNAAMEFTTLERTARHYDATMRLIETAREHLPIRALEVDYHRLVRHFDTVTREICAFTDLKWSESLSRFDRTAKARGVATASAGQVRRGLYDGRGQWEPYAAYLEPVMPILQPWIEKFGYA